MEGEMPRPTPSLGFDRGMPGQLCVVSKFVNDDLVKPEIGCEHKFSRRINVHRVGMRFLLPIRIHTRSLVLHGRDRFTQGAILVDRIADYAPTAVVRNHTGGSGGVHRDVAWTTASGRLPIDFA